MWVSAVGDRSPRWAFKLRAVQYAHLEMYHQMISTSLLPRRCSEKAIFDRVVYTVSQNWVQTQRKCLSATSRKKKKKKEKAMHFPKNMACKHQEWEPMCTRIKHFTHHTRNL